MNLFGLFRNIRTNQTKAHNDSAHKGGTTIAGRTSQLNKKNSLAGIILTLAISAVMIFGNLTPAFADDLVNTVPSDENYRNTINTNLQGTATYGSGYGPYTVDGVVQSGSSSSASTFASGLPLSTIYIDQSKVGKNKGDFSIIATDPTFAPGIEYSANESWHTVRYNPLAKNSQGQPIQGLKQILPNTENILPGELFSMTFKDAAILPDGSKANLRIIYSDAKIFVDQRVNNSALRENKYLGAVNLVHGSSFTYGGTDSRSLRDYYGDVAPVAKAYGSNYTKDNASGGNANPVLGQSLTAKYQIVDDNGIPIKGTFIFAVAGINLDRDPDRGDANNVTKPLWYLNDKDKAGSPADKSYPDYQFWSESMLITGAPASQNIYVRPNSDKTDSNTAGNAYNSYFHPAVQKIGNNIKFTSNAVGSSNASDDAYCSGFVTLADAASGFTLTATGHGSSGSPMNTQLFASKTIWYRYISSTGPHGTIQTTSEGNFNGRLNDGGDILGPGTYVATEGKTITYTMTPDVGYKLSKLTIGGNKVEFDDGDVSRMKKGDSIVVSTADASKWSGEQKFKGQATLKYEDNGTYTLKINHATADEKVHVEWEHTTADILYSKVWKDGNDKDGMRKFAYSSGTKPKVKLQSSTNGKNWTDVDKNAFGVKVASQEVPDGKDSSGRYLDGTYKKDNGTAEHPFTWEYLPVYSYDSSGRADKILQYRIVEEPDPGVAGYKNAQYFDSQSFDLTSEEIVSYDGWTVYRDSSNNEYVLKGDGKYYTVNDWAVGNEADPQPDPASLSAVTVDKNKIIDGLQVKTDSTTGKEYVLKEGKYYEVNYDEISRFEAKKQPQAENLTNTRLNGYFTADKALKYQSVHVKNEHTPREIYVDVTKEWNDERWENEAFKDAATKPSGGNGYSRRDIKFVLSGKTSDGADVDLNGSKYGEDLELIIKPDETDSKNNATGDKKIDRYTVYKDSSGNEFALVEGDSTHHDGYYAVNNGEINYTAGPDEGASGLKKVKKGDGTYKDENKANEFGAMFEDLPTHEGGKLITYTVKEQFKEGDVWKDANTSDIAWTTVGGELKEIKDSGNEVLGYETKFVNTPVIDDTYNTICAVLDKRDSSSKNPLKDAVFTIYTNAVSEEKASSSYRQVDRYTVRTDGSKNYVLKENGKYYEVSDSDEISSSTADPQPSGTLTKVPVYRKIDDNQVWSDRTSGRQYVKKSDGYYEVDDEGKIAEEKADPQPAESSLIKATVPGQVDETVLITGTDGKVTINFNKPGTYYMKETSAPLGYKPDDTIYTFEVNRDLTSITLKDVDDGHKTKWWERLFELLFGDHPDSEKVSWNKDTKTLTVMDDPVTANVLVRKVWNDNEDQDGLRPADYSDRMPTVTLQWTLDGENWNNAKVIEGSTPKDAKEKVTHAGGPLYTHQHDAYTWSDLPAYRDGKRLTYRVLETGRIIDDSSYSIEYNETVDTKEKTFDLATTAYRDANGNRYILKGGAENKYHAVYSNGTIAGTAAVPQPDPSSLTEDGIATLHQTVGVSNKHIPQIINIEVHKKWVDENGSKRPGSVSLSLYKIVDGAQSKVSDLTMDGTADEGDTDEKETAPSGNGNIWNGIFSELPAKEDGHFITYFIAEDPVPDDYAAQYIASYTDNDNKAVSNKTGRVTTSAVRRTFNKTETIKAGDITYDVYKDSTGKKYVKKGEGEEAKYYAITESGGIDDQPADPQPSAELSKLEDTSADITTVNTELEDINTTKYWINGANANVRFYLYRTTQKTLDKSDLVTKDGSAKAPALNGEKVADRDVYVDGAGNKLVKGNTTETEDKYYKVTGETIGEETSPQYRTWSPFDLNSEGKKQYEYTGEDTSVTTPITEDAYNALKDASLKSQYKLMMADGWELVPDAEHLFVSSAFKTETTSPGDDEKHKFESLPRYDNDGNEYTYRVLETTTAGATSDPRFEASYSEDGLTVTNTNILTEDGTAEVNVVKNLQGRKWLDTDTFYFRMDPLKNVDEATGGYTEYSSDDSDRNNVPMPGQVNRATDGSYKGYVIGRAREVNTVRTTTGRSVSFSPILYDQEDFDSEATQKVFYYRVYESNADGQAISEKTDNKGITYDGKTSGNEWTAKYAILKVTVHNNEGKITTDREWFDSVTGSWSGNAPVFTNTYNSEGTAKIWIEKEIKGRNWETFDKKLLKYEGDAFQFRISSISGAHINMPDEEGQIKPSDSYLTKPVTNVTSGSYSYHTDKRVSDHTVTVGIYGNPYTGDMLNDEGWANFIYAIDENGNVKETGRDGYASVDSEYTVDDLDYDKNTVYLKLHVQDNWDGTLTFTANYYEDAPCTKEITSNKAWVVDKTDINERVLMTDDQIRDMADMTPEAIKAAGYREVSVAHFTNLNTVDIPVKKEWVGGPAVEDVTLRLERHLFPLEAEEYLDSTEESTAQHPTGDDYVEKQKKDWDEDKDKEGPFWETAGYTAVIKRGDFLKEDGTPKYNDGTTTSSKTYSGDDAIEGFNKDVPMYVVRNGEIYRAVYRLVENNTSDAYTRSYRSEQSGSADKDGDRVFIDSGTLVITNTVKAVNVAKVAAVKQLLGRRWLNSDDFEFEIKPYGKAVYNKGTGDFKEIDKSVKAKAEVPMPVRYVNKTDSSDIITATAYSKLSDEDKENYKSESTNVAHARSKDKDVDPNGGLERLAGFDEIWYTVSDLTHDPSEGSSRMKGDFYYEIKEKLPAITEDVYPVAYSYTTGTGDKKKTESKEITDKQMPSMEDGQTLKTVTFSDGITYDCDVHYVHVSVQENRTDDLQVQIAYDYTDDEDIGSGTQFTPVYTNKYDSAGEAFAQVRKRMMGRDFKDAESFDFSLTPVSGAPLNDADPDEFIENEKNATQQQKEDALINDKKAIHSDDGSSYITRLTVGKEDGTEGEGRLIRKFPKILFTASDLDRQTVTVDELEYSDGTAVPAGTPYGRFVYAIREIKASDSSLRLDNDTEYVRFTVIDTLDGDLDIRTEYFTDYYCTEDSRRFELDDKGVPKTDEYGREIPSKSAPFVNQIKRSLEVTKAWADPANRHVVFRLQWSITGDDETGWYDVDKAEFMSGVPSTQEVTRGASGDELTKSWYDLPAYANITDVNDQKGDTIDTNDKWLYYRVIEDHIDHVETYYNETPYKDGETRDTETEGGAKKYVTVPFHTGEEKITDEQQPETWNPDNLKKAKFNVTNFRKNIEAEERFSVVKKLVGKKWTDEVFSFKVEPEKSAVGAKASKSYTDTDKYTAYDAESNKMPALLGTTSSTDGSDSTQIAFDERTARFAGVRVKLSDLAVDPADGRMKGEFIYKISEIIPDGATAIKDGKYKVYTDSNGDQIKCTTETHTVKIYAENDGYGNIELTVSYDDRKPGQFIPVFTNYVLAPHLEGLKTWRGGEESKYVNGTVSLDENDEIIADPAPADALGLKLCRKLETDEADPAEISRDLADRELVIVWVKETQKTEIIAYTNGNDEISPEEYEALTPEQQGGYIPVTRTVTERTKQEKGDGYYTVKAKTSDGKYVEPMLDAVDSEGTGYVYSISETNPPEKYSATCRRMNVVNRYSVRDSIKVTKTWDDSSDAEGIRPESVNVHLYKIVKDGDTEKLVQAEAEKKEISKQNGDSDDKWSTGIVWNDLPVYDGNEYIEYVVTEESVAGYTTKYKVGSGEYLDEGDEKLRIKLDGDTDKDPQTVDVKNSLTPETSEVRVKKIWDDNDNVDGKRPENGVTFRLYERVWNKTNKAYGSEKPATYADGSDVPDLTLDGTIDDNTSAKVKETAADANDPLNRWNGEFTGLAQTKNGKTVIYYVKEETDLTAPGYGYKQAVVTGNQLDGFTVTNKHTPETTTASITKNWVDKNNALNTRPKTVTFRLMRTYEGLSTPEQVDRPSDSSKKVVVKLSADDEGDSDPDSWSRTIRNLPAKILVNGQSKPITYFWQEVVPKGYMATGKYNNADIEAVEGNGELTATVDNNSTVTNTMVTGGLDVTKTWDDNNDHDKLRPSTTVFSDKIRLFAGNTEITDFSSNTGISKTVTAGDGGNSNKYTVKFTGLPVYDASGNKIIYRIEESDIESYSIDGTPSLTASLDKAEGETSYNGGISLTNKHESDTVDVEVTKNWFDAEDDKGSHAHMSAADYANHVVLYADNVAVNNGSGTPLRPTVTATGDPEDGAMAATFELRWEGLPKYKVSGGKLVEIVYSAKEDTEIEGYADISADDPVSTSCVSVYDNKGCLDQANKNKLDAAYNGGEINNIQLINIDVVKTWDDDSDHDGKRPETIKLKLFRNGVAYRDELTLNKSNAVISGDNNNIYTWSKAWKDLPYADRFGVPYNYTAVEIESSSWYQALIGTESMHQVLLSSWNEAYDTLTFELTNKYDPEKVSFTVDKIWNDSSDVDGLRPSTITYKLYKQSSDDEKTLVAELPKGASIADAAGNALTMGTDGDITVSTNKDDKKQGVLSRIVFSGLPKYERVKTSEDGVTSETYETKKITYSIEEDAVRGYNLSTSGEAQTVTAVGSQEAGFTVTNVHKPVSASVQPEAHKAITGRNFRSADANKDEFTFKLEATGDNALAAPTPTPDWVTIYPVSGSGTANIKFNAITFTGADMTDKLNVNDTKTFTYKVSEVNGGKTIDDLRYDASELEYVVTLTRQADGTITAAGAWKENKNTFTNHYEGTVDLTLRKVWVDEDADSTVIDVRPASAELIVTATTHGTSEAEIAADTASLTADSIGFTKADESNTYTKTVTLTSDDKSQVSENVHNDDAWETVLSNLPKYDSTGEKIKYSVSEEQVPNYKAPVIESKSHETVWIVTNTYERSTFTGTKVWKDDHETHDNVHELAGKLKLYRSATPSDVDSWTEVNNFHIDWSKDVKKTSSSSEYTYEQSFTITGLPEMNDKGKTYVYRVKEKEELGTEYNGYHVTYDNSHDSADENTHPYKTHYLYNGGTITNKLGETVDIEGIKTWVGGDKATHVNADENGNDKLGLKLQRRIMAEESQTEANWVDVTKDDYRYGSVTEGRDLVVVWDDKTGNSEYEFRAIDSDSNVVDATLNLHVDPADPSKGEYEYRVLETAASPDAEKANSEPTLSGYTVSHVDGTYDIVNTSQEIHDIEVEKVWKGDDDVKDTTRKDIELKLVQEVEGTSSASKKNAEGHDITNPQKVATGTHHAEQLTAKWEKMPLYIDGHKVNYTVEEVDVPEAYDAIVEYGLAVEEGADAKWTKTKPSKMSEVEVWNYKVRVTNTLKTDTTKVVVQKRWDDNDDQDGIRPESVKIHLYNDANDNSTLNDGEAVWLKDGALVAANVEGAAEAVLTLDDSNNWKSVFNDLPKQDGNGKIINYRVYEDPVMSDGSGSEDDSASSEEGRSSESADSDADDASAYTTMYEYGSTDDGGSWHKSKLDTWNHMIRITNSYKPGQITVTATKQWSGETAEVGTSLRTDVILHLYGMDNDGLVVFDAGTKKIEANKEAAVDSDAGIATWTNIPKRHYENDDLEWMITEEPVFGYTSAVTGDITSGFMVTNTYTGPTASVSVTKEWKDTYYDDYKGKPSTITYELWKKVGNDVPVHVEGSDKTVNAGENNLYEASWKDLPVTEKRTVDTEEKDSTARTEYVQDMNKNGWLGYKNLETGKIEYDNPDVVAGTVISGDESTENGDTGEGETESESVSLTEPYYTDTSKYEPYMVPKKITEETAKTEVVPVLYSVKEKYDDSLKEMGYQEPVVVSEGPGEFKVINIHETKTTSYDIKKAWNDQDDADRLRPDHVTVRLMNGETEVRKAVVTSEDGWEHKFMNVPVTDSEGKSITYTVKENDVEGYTPAYPDSLSTESANTITNTHQAGSVVSLRAVKKWSGDDSDKSKRKAVTFHLVKVYVGEDSRIRKVVYGKEYDRTAGDENDWTAVWDEKLPTAEKGNKIFWTVEEEAVDGYNDSVGDSKEVYTAVAIGEGDNPKEKGLYEKDGEESYKLTEDITPVADKEYFALTFEVTVTNTKKVTPAPPAPADNSHYDVIYVDPRNPVGKNAMIVQSTKYDTYEEARKAAESGADTMPSGGIKAAEADADKPKDPSHKGAQFIGWDLNWDENDNFVLVATYSDIPEEVTPVVSYVDGQAKDPLLKSKITNDPSSVKKPKDPKHKNLQFVGWKKTVDAGGNTIFVASYKPDCKNGSGDSTSNTYRTGNGKPHVKTGDENAEIVLWILVLIMASALMAIYVYDRRRSYKR